MARPQQHPVEYISSPQPTYSHFQQSSSLQAAMPPLSPPQCNRSHHLPGQVFHQPQPQHLSPLSPESVPLPQPQACFTHIPPHFPQPAVNNGAYHLANIAALSPPSISWITHTQSPPLHPFPPPIAPMNNIHSIQPAPPRLTHSPSGVPPNTCGYAYQDHNNNMLMQQSYPQTNGQAHGFHQVHHAVHDILTVVQPGNLHMQQHGAPSHQLRSPPPPGYHHHHELIPPPPAPPPPSHHHPGPHLQMQDGGPLPHPALPFVREGWMRSPPPQQQQQQQFYQIPTGPNHNSAIPHLHPHSALSPHIRMQFLPHTAPMQTTSTIRNGTEHSVPHLAAPQQVTSTTVQLLQSSLQPVSMSTVVRPTAVHTSQPIPGFFRSATSEPGFLVSPPPIGQQVTTPQKLVAQQQWMARKSHAMSPTSLKTSALLTTPPQAHQGSAPDTVLEQTQPLNIPMSSQEAKEWDEYKEFAAIFRNHRVRLSFTQDAVARQVNIRFNHVHPISEDTIAQFEQVHLPLAKFRELKLMLQAWLKEAVIPGPAGTSEEEIREIVVHASTSINPRRERKRRTNVDSVIKGQLEEEFRRKRTPSQSEMQSMANRFGMEKEFIRVWFCNRRQRQKKLEKDLKEAQAKQTPVPSPKATIPSPSHDITVMVPSIDPRDAGSPIHEGYKFRRTC